MLDLRESLLLSRPHKRTSCLEHLHYYDKSSDMLFLQGFASQKVAHGCRPEGAAFAKCFII